MQFITQYFELAVVKLKIIINYLAHSFLLPIKNRQIPTYTGREKQKLRDTEQRDTHTQKQAKFAREWIAFSGKS